MKEETNWYEKDSNEALGVIYDEIEDDGERFEFLKYLIENFPKLEIDWLETFEDLKEYLLAHERIDDILFFVNWYSKTNPEDYGNRYEFVEGVLCDYYLFKRDFSSLKQRIAFIQQNPAPAIDTLTSRLLFQLIYHGQYGQAVDFSEKVWKPIDQSSDLIGFAAYDFINTIHINQLQKYYESVLNNTPFDTGIFLNNVVEMGYSNERGEFEGLLRAVDSDLDMELIKKSIKEKKAEHMLHLNVQFLKYMFNQFNLPFIFSELLWQFIATQKIFGKRGKENWFFINAKTMDRHIVYNYDGFYSSNQQQIFGKVWGFDYIISFLSHYKLITPEHFQIMAENNNYFKNEMMKILGNELWKVMFVFDWPVIDASTKNDDDPAFFRSTFNMDYQEARNSIDEYVSAKIDNERIIRELK